MVKTGPSFLSVSLFYSVLGVCSKNTNSVNWFQNIVFAKLLECQNEAFERKLHSLFLSSYVAERETEMKKHKMEKG